MNKFYKLKSNIIAEPLVNHWYAWAYLISPATYSMILSESHLKILRSYVNAPHLHLQTSKIAQLSGGPFVNFDEENQLKLTSDLIELIEKKGEDLLLLSDLIKQANTIIKQHVNRNGPASFFHVYDILPVEIRGLIELVYDVNNFPSIRIIEALLYKTSYYNENFQAVLFYPGHSDKRDFILSTPRFPGSNGLLINIPFSSYIYDLLFSSRSKAISFDVLEEIYSEIHAFDKNLSKSVFLSFFDEKDVADFCKKNNDDKSFKITYIGHACVLIQSENISILIDPLIPYDMPSPNVSRHSYSDLPEVIDYILITHAHKDHAALETLLQLRHKTKVVVVPDNVIGAIQDVSLKLVLENCGFRNVISLREFENITIFNGNILAVPSFGEHGDLNIQSKLSYCITLNDSNVLFLSDSKNQEPFLYKRLAKILPKIDYLFIGMECEGAPLTWLYGALMQENLPKHANQSRRLDGSDALQAFELVSTVKCNNVFVYAMAHEPWLGFISNINYKSDSKQIQEAKKFVDMCELHGISARILFGSEDILQ